MKKTWDLNPAWRLLPAPPDANANAVFNENIINRLADGSVRSVPGIQSIDETSITTADGSVDVDVIIFCTGYHFDYSFLGPRADPTNQPAPEWQSSPHSNGLPFPRLYQTLFHSDYPSSLAFIGPCQGYTFASFNHADLASQAIAQVWLGLYPLPCGASIHAWCEENYRASLKQVQKWRVPKTGTDNGRLEAWLNRAAGNGVQESLAWGLAGWTFWWKERKLYRLIMDGVNTPFVYRLFEGRPGSRKAWLGAREAIYRANGVQPS
jgi:dimethylaniline monooxygenase (N-oxide forming)